MVGFYNWDGKPISMWEWVALFERPRHVADTHLDEVRVSTVWLGSDHNFSSTGPPLIFETMVFGGPLDEEQVRYATLEQARAGHDFMVMRLTTLNWEEADVNRKEGEQ